MLLLILHLSPLQLNVTYSELYDVNFVNGRNVGKARQPGGTVLPELTLDPIINVSFACALSHALPC